MPTSTHDLNTNPDRKTIVVLMGDMHINMTMALLAPTVELDDGLIVHHNHYQQWIWQQFEALTDEIAHLKKRHKAPVFLVYNGEIADNNSHATSQLVTNNEADIERMAYHTLHRINKLADYIIVTRGTEAHTGLSSNLDERMAQLFKALPDPTRNTSSWWRFTATLGGVNFDIAHHPGVGHSRRARAGTDAITLAGEMLQEYHLLGAQKKDWTFPDLVIRGHNHKPSDSYDNQPIRCIINASWALGTVHAGNSFGYRIGGSILPIGAMYAICESGHYTLTKRFAHYPVQDNNILFWTPELLRDEHPRRSPNRPRTSKAKQTSAA